MIKLHFLLVLIAVTYKASKSSVFMTDNLHCKDESNCIFIVYTDGTSLPDCSDNNMARIEFVENGVPNSRPEGVIVICMKVSNGDPKWVPLCYDENATKYEHEAVAHTACRQKGHLKAYNNSGVK